MRTPMVVSLFPKGVSLHARFLVLLLFSLALIIFDRHTTYCTMIRQAVLTSMQPLYVVAQWPVRLGNMAYGFFEDRVQQLQNLDRLQHEHDLLHLQLHALQAVKTENARLRALLHAKPRVSEEVAIANIMAFNPDPFVHELTIDKGAADGVFKGQVAVDAKGLIGQVIDVAWHTAVVLLLTDAAHAVPVENKRTHSRAILSGTGGSDLHLLHVTSTADVRVGDQLLSSALGGRFPQGYPVGIVEDIVQDAGQPFLKIHVRPIAEPNKAHELLLLSEALQATKQASEASIASSIASFIASEQSSTEKNPQENIR